MALLDDLTALPTARRVSGGVPCRVSTILNTMSSEERGTLERLLDASEVVGTQLASTLRNHGYQISGSQVQHHRRRLRGAGCSCPLPNEAA